MRRWQEKYPDGFGKDDIEYAELDNDKVVLLNYTSRHDRFQ